MTPIRVGVLSFHNSTETKAILNAIDELGHTPVWLRRHNVAAQIRDGTEAIDPAVDVVVNRLLVTKSDSPLRDLSMAEVLAAEYPMVNRPRAVSTAVHKYRTATILADAGVPIPDTGFPFGRSIPDRWDDEWGSPAVRKPAIGTNGTGVELVDEPTPTRNPGTLVQRFHPSGSGQHADIRVYVVDGRIVGAMRRTAPDDEWRSNVALGGEVTDVTTELPNAIRRHAVRATDALGIDCAGVDIVRGADGPVVIEVNPTAGFKGLFEATGTSPAPFIAAAALERAGRTVPPSEVTAIADTLDDSVPECKPARPASDGGRSVLGYTTSVSIGGKADEVTLSGKVDTGADRTTIDMDVAGEIGAGPVVGVTDVTVGTASKRRPLVDVDVQIDGDRWRDLEVGIADRSGKRHPVLLGRDVLDEFTIDPRRGGMPDAADREE